MKKRILLLIILLPLWALSQRQGQLLIDSLTKVLPQLKDDKNKVNVLTSISTTYARIDCAKGIAIGQQSLALARQLTWPPGMGNAYLALGSNYTTSADYAKALACLDTAYTIGAKNGLKGVMLLSLVDQAVVYNQQGYYAMAIDLSMKSLKIAEEIRDSSNIALNLNNIGTINAKIGRYDKALGYELQAYPTYERLHNRLMQAMVLSSLGDAYDGVARPAQSAQPAPVLYRWAGRPFSYRGPALLPKPATEKSQCLITVPERTAGRSQYGQDKIVRHHQPRSAQPRRQPHQFFTLT